MSVFLCIKLYDSEIEASEWRECDPLNLHFLGVIFGSNQCRGGYSTSSREFCQTAINRELAKVESAKEVWHRIRPLKA